MYYTDTKSHYGIRKDAIASHGSQTLGSHLMFER